MSNWTLFSNHGHVLVCLARNPKARLRDVASDVGITERAVQKIVSDLQSGGMVNVSKHGRRNHYRIHPKQTLRHDLEANCTLGELLKCVSPSKFPPGQNEKLKVTEPVAAEPVSNVSIKTEQKEPSASKKDEHEVVKVEEKSTKPDPDESIEKLQGLLF